MNFNFCKSSDDSNTLFSIKYQEHYHSISEGALNESMQKHINPSLGYVIVENTRNIDILDICFGLGYNVISSLYYLDNLANKDIKINIVSIELDTELIKSLEHFKYPDVFEPYKHIIKSLSNTLKYKDDRFCIEIINDDARYRISILEHKFDIVYQDAFSYKKNPHLWTYEYFKDIKKLLKKTSILTTYSISTKIRLALSENNFFIYDNISAGKKIGTLASVEKIDNKESIDMNKKREKSSIKMPIYDNDLTSKEII